MRVFEPATTTCAFKSAPPPSKYSMILRALEPAPEAKMATWIGAAAPEPLAAPQSATTVRPNNLDPTLLKYPLKNVNCPVKKLTKITEKGHKMVKNRG